jgi:hypothetical protein
VFHVKHSPELWTGGLGPACKPGGLHWHQLVNERGEFLSVAYSHEWRSSTGHLLGPDPRRPHAHKWSEATIRAAMFGQPPGRILYAVRSLAGKWESGPSVAERPGNVTEWLSREEAVALTLHPELRPARLRDL